jgi:hypothetical protein
MNSRERLHRCYFHQELDRPAIYTRTGYADKDPSYDKLKALVAAQFDQKRGWGLRVQQQYKTDTRTEPVSAEFERYVTIIHTPRGPLQSTYLASLKNQPGLHETFLLKTREDAEKFLSLPMPKIDGDAASFFAADREMGERGIVDCSLGSNAGGFVAQLFGSEGLAMMSVTDRDIVHALCERRMKEILVVAEFLVAKGVGPYFSISGQEYIVPPLHGPKDFDDFNLKYDKPIIDLVHNARGAMHIHSHGSVKKVLPSFLAMGADVLHPFEPPPMGDITARDAKQMVRGKITIEGNIQVANMYEHTPDEVRAETDALIADAFGDRAGLIVSPTASPYIYGAGEKCLPQYQAMLDAVLHYQA